MGENSFVTHLLKEEKVEEIRSIAGLVGGGYEKKGKKRKNYLEKKLLITQGSLIEADGEKKYLKDLDLGRGEVWGEEGN